MATGVDSVTRPMMSHKGRPWQEAACCAAPGLGAGAGAGVGAEVGAGPTTSQACVSGQYRCSSQPLMRPAQADIRVQHVIMLGGLVASRLGACLQGTSMQVRHSLPRPAEGKAWTLHRDPADEACRRPSMGMLQQASIGTKHLYGPSRCEVTCVQAGQK